MVNQFNIDNDRKMKHFIRYFGKYLLFKAMYPTVSNIAHEKVTLHNLPRGTYYSCNERSKTVCGSCGCIIEMFCSMYNGNHFLCKNCCCI